MTPDDGSHRWWSCARKHKYSTEAVARDVASRATRKHKAPPLDIYRCLFCNCWHLTHKRKGTITPRGA